jgi:hypothetical protein
MDFFEEQSEIVGQLETDIIYQFTCILERERNRNLEEQPKVQEEQVAAAQPQQIDEPTQVEDDTENIVPSNTAERPNLFNKFSQINIQKLQNKLSQPSQLSQPIPAETRADRIVPKLGSLNRGSFLDMNTFKTSISSNGSQIEKVPFLLESRNSGRSLTTSTNNASERIAESKNVSNSNAMGSVILNKASDISFNSERGSIHSNQEEPKPKRQPSTVLQSIAELRKGIAMKKKANQSKMLLNSPTTTNDSVKSTIAAGKSDPGANACAIAIPNTATTKGANIGEGSSKGNVGERSRKGSVYDGSSKGNMYDGSSKRISNSITAVSDGEEIIDAEVTIMNILNKRLIPNSIGSSKIESANDVTKVNEIPIKDILSTPLKNDTPASPLLDLQSSPQLAEKHGIILDGSIIEDISEPEEFLDSILLDEEEMHLEFSDGQDIEMGEFEAAAVKVVIPEKPVDKDQIPSNLYTGTVTSFLQSSNSQISEPSGPITSFLPLLQKDPEPKPKPARPIKALQIAALAAKKV